MRRAVVVVIAALGGCGRVGFDGVGAPDGVVDGPGRGEARGDLDASFGMGGVSVVGEAVDQDARDLAARPGGGYVTVGTHVGSTDAHSILLIGFTASGAIDPAYGYVKHTPFGDEYGYGLVPLAGDRLLVVGDGRTLNRSDDMVLGVVDAAGAPDGAFSGGFRLLDGGTDRPDTARRAAAFHGGALVCGTWSYTQNPQIAVAALTATGALDPSFAGTGALHDDLGAGADECEDIAIDGESRPVIAGHSADRAVVVRYTEGGARDPSFGDAGLVRLGSAAHGLAIAGDGELVVAGEDAGRGLIARLTAAGQLAPGFGTAGLAHLASGDTPNDVALQPNGKLVVVGRRAAGGALVMRWLADGTPDRGFGDGGERIVTAGTDAELWAVRIDDDGAIVAAGSTRAGGHLRPMIVRIE